MTRLLRAARLALVAAGARARRWRWPSRRHGIAMYGEPALPPDFVSLPYANPDAPKGGTIVFGETGGFDSLNPYILKGRAPGGVQTHVFETLMARNWDEPFGLYGLLAESIETGPDREWVEFTLRPEARFSDGSPVTVEDVIWSMQTLAEHGLPRYRNAWEKVASVEQTGERSVRFAFAEPDARAAADHRAAADPEEGRLGGGRLRGEQPAGAGRLGALRRSAPSSPGASSASSATPTTGGGTCRSTAGVNNFDTDPLRVLRRRRRAVPGLHRRRALGLPRDEPGEVGERLRLPGGDVGRGASRRRSRTGGRRGWRDSSSTPGGRSSRTGGCATRCCTPSTTSSSTRR